MAVTTAVVSAIAAVVGASAGVYAATRSAPGAIKPGQEQKTPDEGVRNRDQNPNAGQIATLLSGAGGVNPGSLSLGKSTLLGQ